MEIRSVPGRDRDRNDRAYLHLARRLLAERIMMLKPRFREANDMSLWSMKTKLAFYLWFILTAGGGLAGAIYYFSLPMPDLILGGVTLGFLAASLFGILFFRGNYGRDH